MTTLAKRGSGTPATNGATWTNVTNAVDGTVGSNPATYATFTTAVNPLTGYIEVSGYDFAAIPAGATINSVTVVVRQWVNVAARWSSVQFQPYDNTTALDSIATGTVSTTPHDDTATFNTVTLAQLQSSTFKIRVLASHTTANSSTFNLDHVDVTVDYTAAGPPTLVQSGFRWYEDDAGPATATPHGTQNTQPTIPFGTTVSKILRIQVGNTGSTTDTDTLLLEYRKNGGTWTTVPESATAPVYMAPTSTALTNGQNVTTSRITGGTGTFVSGEVAVAVNASSPLTDTVTAGNYTEHIWVVALAPDAGADVYDLRVTRSGSTTGITYTQTPSMLVTSTDTAGYWGIRL